MEKGTRYEKFKDEKVRKLFKEKDLLLAEIEKMAEEAKKFEERLGKITQKIQKIKDKVKPMVEAHLDKMNLGEFEVSTDVSVDGGDLKVKIVDQVETYKQTIRKRKEDESKANSDSTDKSSK